MERHRTDLGFRVTRGSVRHVNSAIWRQVRKKVLEVQTTSGILKDVLKGLVKGVWQLVQRGLTGPSFLLMPVFGCSDCSVSDVVTTLRIV